MKEVKFQDRVPLYPGRVIMQPVPNQPNTFDMVRADEPTNEGTPLDKATFNSIIHSRLTGRYYTPSVTREINSSRTDLTVNPIPTSNWVFNADNNNYATSGAYTLETNSNNGSDWLADRVFWSGGWQSSGGVNSWIKIYSAAAIKVKNIKFRVAFQYEARFTKLQIQGSNNGTEWVTVGELTSITTGTTIEYELGAPNDYYYYRLYFTSSDSNRVTVSMLSYSLYDVNTYESAFVISEGTPSEWTKEQRIMILTPNTINSLGVIKNTLNGVTVNTILQPSKRYELRYNGTAFETKEV